MVVFLRSQEQAQHLDASVDAAARTVEITKEQYSQGEVDFTPVFLFESILTEQQDQLAVSQGDIALGLIAVYRSLGGGWQIRLAGNNTAAGTDRRCRCWRRCRRRKQNRSRHPVPVVRHRIRLHELGRCADGNSRLRHQRSNSPPIQALATRRARIRHEAAQSLNVALALRCASESFRSCRGRRAGGYDPLDRPVAGAGLSGRPVAGLLRQLLSEAAAVHSLLLARLRPGRLLRQALSVRSVLPWMLHRRLLLPQAVSQISAGRWSPISSPVPDGRRMCGIGQLSLEFAQPSRRRSDVANFPNRRLAGSFQLL